MVCYRDDRCTIFMEYGIPSVSSCRRCRRGFNIRVYIPTDTMRKGFVGCYRKDRIDCKL